MNRKEKIYLPLPRLFYERSPIEVAPALLGQFLVRVLDGETLVGKIVETEAYLGSEDQAAHGYKGKTTRNQSVFGEAGHAYVHTSRHHTLLDVVCEFPDVPSAVLIRAIEPIEGIENMRKLRGVTDISSIGSGPGKLCQALGIIDPLDGIDMTLQTSELLIAKGIGVLKEDIGISPRIGISVSADLPLRFWVTSSSSVSR